jgi:heme exporter protein C
VVIGLALVAWYAPVEREMGPVQKIFYFHLPVATIAFVACFTVFAASAAYLWQRARVWDQLAHAAAEVSVLFASVVLLTGMVWAREAWGYWWTWSPRLTFSLVLWLLYVVYLVIRPSIESEQRRAVVCAVYGVVAFLDVPLVYFSTKMMPDIHPSSISLEPAMRQTALFWFAPVGMICVGLIWARFRLLRRSERLSMPAGGGIGRPIGGTL